MPIAANVALPKQTMGSRRNQFVQDSASEIGSCEESELYVPIVMTALGVLSMTAIWRRKMCTTQESYMEEYLRENGTDERDGRG